MLKEHRWIYLAILFVTIHTVLVFLIASAVPGVLAMGEPGYLLWWVVAIPDYPVFLLRGCILDSFRSRFGDVHFWNHTFSIWLFLIGGTIQWFFVAWLLSRCWRVLSRWLSPKERLEPACKVCGYCLRGLPPDWKCPECGTPTGLKNRAASL